MAQILNASVNRERPIECSGQFLDWLQWMIFRSAFGSLLAEPILLIAYYAISQAELFGLKDLNFWFQTFDFWIQTLSK